MEAVPKPLFCLLLFLFLAFPSSVPAQNFHSRVLIHGALRQLRAVEVTVQGFSNISRSAPASRQRVSALHHARQAAVNTVREALETEIGRRELDVGFFVPGADELEAVFDLSHRDLPPDSGKPFGVELRAQVIYVLELASRKGSKKRGLSDNSLKMAPAGQSAPAQDAKKLRSDFARALQSLDKALKARMKGGEEETDAENSEAAPKAAPNSLPQLPMTRSGAN